MKSSFKKSVAILVSVIVLISSNGLELAAHNCFSQHGTEVSLFKHTGCCSKEEKNCHSNPVKDKSFEKKCCELKITYHKVDVSSPSVRTPEVPYSNLFFSDLLFSSSFNSLNYFSSQPFNKPPPLICSGFSLLLSIQKLTI
jgi:hypothetical protein